ncbi:hypothetical protein K505DRAFT_341719, partial [Melanomma pulvis-pyrius CBS 109.77]
MICTAIDGGANGDGDASEGLGTIGALWDSGMIGYTGRDRGRGGCTSSRWAEPGTSILGGLRPWDRIWRKALDLARGAVGIEEGCKLRAALFRVAEQTPDAVRVHDQAEEEWGDGQRGKGVIWKKRAVMWSCDGRRRGRRRQHFDGFMGAGVDGGRQQRQPWRVAPWCDAPRFGEGTRARPLAGSSVRRIQRAGKRPARGRAGRRECEAVGGLGGTGREWPASAPGLRPTAPCDAAAAAARRPVMHSTSQLVARVL